MSINNNNEITSDPVSIAKLIFNSEPKTQNSFQFITVSETSDLHIIYEILITILMEGFNIFTHDFEHINLDSFSSDFITNLNPWFNSFGFRISVDTFNLSHLHLCNNYYCKILIKTKGTKPIFISKNIHKNYHFLLNPFYVTSSHLNLCDIYSIFINNDIIYRINFHVI